MAIRVDELLTDEQPQAWSRQIVPGVVAQVKDGRLVYEYGPGLSWEMIEHIYRQEYRKMVGAVTFRLKGHWEIAEDIVQEAFTWIYEHWQDYQNHPTPRHLIWAMVKTEMNRYRFQRRDASLDAFGVKGYVHLPHSA